jgi:RNA polymerase sigma factor (sigma-70 family)
MKRELGVPSKAVVEFNLPVDSEVEAITTKKRYPVLTHDQIITVFKERNDGKNLSNLAESGFLRAETDPIRHRLMQNAFQDSATIDDLIVLCNLGLITNVAKQYTRRGIEFQDLMQEGVFGIYRSLDDYDPKRGEFSTFATKGIKNAIVAAVRRDYAPILRPPADLQDAIWSGKKAWSRLALELQRKPTHEELYAELVTLVPRKGRAKDAVDIIMSGTDSVASLDAPISARADGSEITLGDVIPDKPIYLGARLKDTQTEQIRDTVHKVLKSDLLPVELAKVIKLNFGVRSEPSSYAEIGREMGFTATTAASKAKRALAVLRENDDFAKLATG